MPRLRSDHPRSLSPRTVACQMSDSAGSEPNGELQQREQQARKTYHDKNVEFIRKMSERSRAVKQQMREQAEGRPPDFRLHLNGANKGAEQEA